MASFWFTLAVVVACILTVDATRMIHKPARHNRIAKRAATGKTQFGYYINQGDGNLPKTEHLTHVLCSFADTDNTGAVKLIDDNGSALDGPLKQLYPLKLKNRTLKTILSIGGGKYSQNGHFAFVTTPSNRATFTNSLITVIEDYGLDGADIDFEFPANDEQATAFASLLTETRAALDKLASRKGDKVPYILSAAVTSIPYNYKLLKISQMDAALDYWNLMAYDYSGPWIDIADHQSNLFGGSRTGVSTDSAIKYYIANGATASKINVGIPLYGRVFQNTKGLGKPYNGIGPEAYPYSRLPLPGAKVSQDQKEVSSYSYDSSKQELITFDTPDIVKAKSDYIVKNGLAGTMFWQLGGDKEGTDSLVATAARQFGTLDQTPNHVSYPGSKYDEIRKGGSA